MAGGVRHRQDEKYAAREQAAYDQQQAAYDQGAADARHSAASAVAGPCGTGGDDTMAELEKLADMKSKGLLSDDEFAAAKAKILGG